jgi:hypothetical protein
LARFRCTALPTERLVLIPTLGLSSTEGSLTNTTSGCAKDLPWFRTRLKSMDRVRRKRCFTPASSARRSKDPRRTSLPADPFDVVINFDRQLCAAAAATPAQNFTSVGSGHSLAETMHAHASANLGLICSFSSHFPLPLLIR